MFSDSMKTGMPAVSGKKRQFPNKRPAEMEVFVTFKQNIAKIIENVYIPLNRV